MSVVLWFTGLSGSGKSTLAERVQQRLEHQSKKVVVLDGDAVRSTITKHLGFSREDIRENNRLIAELAEQKMREADVVLVPIISPYRDDRQMAREIIGKNFREVFVYAPLQECIRRDSKGLYRQALAGEIKNFIGISPSHPYEPPPSPHLTVSTAALNVEESVEKIMNYLHQEAH